MVLASTFTINCLNTGVLSAGFAVMYSDIVGAFDTSVASVGLIISVTGLMWHIPSLGYRGLLARFSYRRVGICGTMLGCICTAISAFSPNITVLTLLVCLGTPGLGATGYAGNIALQHYFSRRRGLAGGLAVTGISTGYFLFGPLMQYLTEVYGWRGARLISAAILAHNIIAATCLRPHPTQPPDTENKDATCHTDQTKDKGEEVMSLKPVETIDEKRVTQDEKTVPHTNKIDENIDEKMRTDEDNTYVNSKRDLPEIQDKCDDTMFTNHVNIDVKTNTKDYDGIIDEDILKSNDVETHTQNDDGGFVKNHDKNNDKINDKGKPENRALNRLGDPIMFVTGSNEDIVNIPSTPKRTRTRRVTEISHNNSIQIAESTSDLASDKPSSSCSTICDFSVLRNPAVLLYGIACGLTAFGISGLYNHLPNRCLHLGMTAREAALMASLFGIGNVIGRVGFSLLLLTKCMNIRIQCCVLMLLSALATTAIGITHGFWDSAVVVLLASVALGGHVCVRITTMRDLAGLPQLPQALALSMMLAGVTSALSSFTLGFIYDMTLNYNISFLVCGGVELVGAGFMCAAVIVNRMKERKQRRHDTQL